MTGARRRILYVQPNSEVGGADLALLRMIESLDLAKFEPHVALPKDGPVAAGLRAAGAQVHHLPMIQLRTLPSASYQLGYLAAFWPTVFRLRALIKANAIELVHTNSLYSLYGGFAALLAGRTHIWHVREIPPQIPVARPALGAMVLALSRRVISMTQACTRGLAGRADHPKIRLLSEGLDLAKWTRRPDLRDVRAELGIGPETPVVGFVARLDPWKGLNVFIEAAALVAARFPDAVFLVSGDAPSGFEAHRDDMAALARRLGLGDNIRFLGWRYRMDDIPAVMAALDVFCHTSIEPEPFGLVVIEAMAMQTAVVAARAGGPLEIIEEGVSGLLTPPGDAQALADTVGALLADPVRRRAIAAGGRARVELRHSRAAFGRSLEAIYADALGGDAP